MPSLRRGVIGLFGGVFFLMVFAGSAQAQVIDPSTAASCRATGGTCYAAGQGAGVCSNTDGQDASCAVCCAGSSNESDGENNPWESDDAELGGIGDSCFLASDDSLGSCQIAGSACPGGSGVARSDSACGQGQVCCRQLTTGGSGTGAGSGTGTGTGGGGGTTTSSRECPSGFNCSRGIAIPTGTGLSSAPILFILRSIMFWLLSIFGMIAIIAFVISGIQYITAAGDDAQMETGKKNMQYSIIGVIIALSGLIIIQAIDMALRGSWFF